MDSKNQYRPSASLIIAAATTTTSADANYDYQLLLFKRTEHTAYAPDHCVFPGGVFEANADESTAWLSYFREFNISPEQLEQQFCVVSTQTTQRPHPLLTSGQAFSRDLSLRITAIRETFEEVGVLLCRDRESLAQSSSKNGHFREDFDRALWQRRVHNDPQQLLSLCRLLQVVPDVWSLCEWSVWRSPTTSSKKYDTVFYFVALPQQPQLLLEHNEVAEAMWHSPSTFLQLFKARLIWLPPQLYYELSRLTHAHKYAELTQFAHKRNRYGSTLLQPVYHRLDDGLVGILPGDDFYPSNPEEHTETIVIPSSTMREFSLRVRQLHRFTYTDMYDICVELNINPIDSHMSPVREESISSKL